jgi:hypothetical protein
VRASIAADPYFQANPSRCAVMESYVPIVQDLATRARRAPSPSCNEIDATARSLNLAQQVLPGPRARPSLTTADRRLREILR